MIAKVFLCELRAVLFRHGDDSAHEWMEGAVIIKSSRCIECVAIIIALIQCAARRSGSLVDGYSMRSAVIVRPCHSRSFFNSYLIWIEFEILNTDRNSSRSRSWRRAWCGRRLRSCRLRCRARQRCRSRCRRSSCVHGRLVSPCIFRRICLFCPARSGSLLIF